MFAHNRQMSLAEVVEGHVDDGYVVEVLQDTEYRSDELEGCCKRASGYY
jgi:hypothetical protein